MSELPYSYEAPASQALFDRAAAVTPGGVNSPVRAFRAVGGTPRFMVSGSGPYLTDSDGREYVDLVCSWGPMILGHAHPEVIAAVQEAVARGTSFGTPGEGEVALAEEMVARIEPLEQVRLVSSGTEATMSAIRLARGFTRRTKVIKFAAATTATSTRCSPPRAVVWRRSRCPTPPASPAPRPATRSCCRTTTWTPCTPRSPRTRARSPA